MEADSGLSTAVNNCARPGAAAGWGGDGLGVTGTRILRDFQGLAIRLTEERLAHVLEHPEMAGMEAAIEETLLRPERVVQSFSDPRAHLYYRLYLGTRVGDKHLCVVVKVMQTEAFVVTAYLTDKIKRGVLLWPREN